MKIAIAADHAGYDLKEKLKQSFASIDWLDLGTHSEESVDYPAYGFAMGQAITDGRARLRTACRGTRRRSRARRPGR